jgi:hypothetical protein
MKSIFFGLSVFSSCLGFNVLQAEQVTPLPEQESFHITLRVRGTDSVTADCKCGCGCQAACECGCESGALCHCPG